MTRLQEHRIEQLALRTGRVAVRDGYTDECVRVTEGDGKPWRITPEGVLIEEKQYGHVELWPEEM